MKFSSRKGFLLGIIRKGLIYQPFGQVVFLSYETAVSYYNEAFAKVANIFPLFYILPMHPLIIWLVLNLCIISSR